MRKIPALVLAALICLGLLSGCAADEGSRQTGRTVIDGAGRQVEVLPEVESVVCAGVGALLYGSGQ